jgi:hypothetical protein
VSWKLPGNGLVAIRSIPQVNVYNHGGRRARILAGLQSATRQKEAELVGFVYRYPSNLFRFLLSFPPEREPRRIEVRERLFQLAELRRRAMHFYPGEIGHGEHFRKQCANVVEMRENAFGVGVAFAAENFVAVDSKPVEKILFLRLGFLDETRKPGFDRLQFPGMHFELISDN